MSYKGQPQRILSGSWNLLPPGDLVKPPDAQWIQNWRVDQAGALRSRPGSEEVASIPAGGPVRTLWRRAEHRYYGSGGELWRQTGAAGSPVLLASGYDGQPIGAASFQGFAWFMHRAKQKKDDGVSCSDWLASAPTTAPAVSAGAQQTNVITGFNQETGLWSVWDPEGEAAEIHWDTDNKIEGSASLWIPITPAGTWQAERLLTKDLRIDGQQRADDKCRIWINCSDPSKITQIDLIIDVNDASFDRDYYRVSITPAQLSEQRWGWTCVEIYREFDAQAGLAANSEYTALQAELAELEKRAQNLGDPSGWEQQRMDAIRDRLRALAEEVQATLAFRRVGTTPGKDWSTVAAIRIQVVASDLCDVNFDQWEFYGGVQAPIEGDVRYCVTFDTEDGHETNAGPESEIHANKQAVTLTGIPTSPDGQVTKRHIYRGGGTLGATYRVGTIPDNVTTTYVDRLPDQDALHEKMLETDRDGPPPAMGLAGPYFGQLLAYGSDEHPNWLWWSKVNQPSCWPGSSTEEGHHEPVGDDGEVLLRVTTHKRLAILYKERSIWRLLGDPNDEAATIEQTNANIGILGPRAVADAGALDYFAGPQGVYGFDFDRERKISEKLDPIFKGAYTELADGIRVPPISSQAQYRARAVLAYANDLLYFSYPEEGQMWPSITVVYNPATEQWVSMRTAAALGQGFTALYYEGEGNELLAGSSSGHVYAYGYGATDAGQAIPLRYLSGYHNQGLPDNEKIYEDLVIEHDTGGASITVKVVWDNGAQVQTIGSVSSTTRTRTPFQVGQYGKGRRAYNVALLLDGDATSEVVIYGVTIHAEPEPRVARSWDSGVFDCGTDQVKEIDGLEFDIEAEGTVTYSLYGDLPEGNLYQRKADSFPATGGRKTVPVSFAVVEARRGRLYLSSEQGFRPYGVRVRVRAIGEYFDGSKGEVWESAEVGYGG
ncbi:MAG: hypothetical protein FJW34_00020 [Acidobacteria bacterium]|nr:hypothetical protein [Acidobacteriota bacterium]